MEKIIWNESFSVGVLELDKQHKKLLKMLNKIIEAKNISVDSEAISDVLTEMTKYAEYHFKTEERYMIKYNYPNYAIHENEHKEFLRQTANFCIDVTEHKESTPTEILSYLEAWLINHILKSDMKYKSFVNKKGLK
ncbi:MAG: hemerythrin family protein [Proteobacteria bacterium]|nr:hemerythrin family protein [Pseudomonadota bacterium]